METVGIAPAMVAQPGDHEFLFHQRLYSCSNSSLIVAESVSTRRELGEA